MNDCISHGVPHLVLDAIKERPDDPALYFLKDNAYHPITFREMALRAQTMAAYIALHGKKGDRLAIWSNNRWEWLVTDLAAQLVGVITVPIYPTIALDQLSLILEDAKPSIVFLDHLNEERITCLSEYSESCRVVTFSDLEPGARREGIIDFTSILRSMPKVEDIQDEKWMAFQLKDIVTILYTSGTTGTQKAVPLTHDNIVDNVKAVREVVTISNQDSTLSFLPLSHIFERTVGCYCILSAGGAIYYAESMDTVARDLCLAKPTIVVSVPRLYEKIYQTVMVRAVGVQRWVLKAAVAIGYLFPGTRKLRRWQQTVFHAIHEKMGGRVRFLVTGGAAIPSHVQAFFEGIGLPMIQGYGLTETSPIVTVNTTHTLGSIGQPLPNLQLRIQDDGELLVKGPTVFDGYLNMDNEDVFTDDGFFKTGDLVWVGPGGHLFIVGRKKELIVLSNGKNVSPIRVENALLRSPLIHQVMVVGDDRHYVSALVVMDADAVASELALSGSPSVDDPRVYDTIHRHIKRYSRRLASFETVKRFVLLDTPWTIEGGELTSTLKLRRVVLNKKYHHDITLLYNQPK